MSGEWGKRESYWMASSDSTSYPALSEDVEVDVAVVGGGIAGLSTAWELAGAGRSVAVFEAGRVAAGVTGSTTAKLSAAHTMRYSQLASAFDAEVARLYAQSQVAAIARAASVATRLDVDCQWEWRPAYTYVTAADGVAQLEAEARAAAEAGLPASVVSDTGLPFPTAGALRVEEQAQFHPRRYLLALADDLVRQGGQIFEHTRVTGLTEGRPCRLETAGGSTVRAADVVVATHYPVFDRAMLFSRLVPRREAVVAAVINADADPAGMYLTEEDNVRSVRTAPYRNGSRLLIVTGEKFTPGAADVSGRLQRLVSWTRQYFDLDTIACHWAAQDNYPADGLPYVGLLHPGATHAWVATGFAGWGMTNGVMAGQLLAALLTEQKPPWARIYDPRRLHPTVAAGALLKGNFEVARHFVGDRIRAVAPPPADTLAPGTGGVVSVDGKRRAVYRDPSGELVAVSPRCSHLGCLVAFNDVDHTWDCPCHGSRFAVDGTVIQGPATKPLERQDPS